MFTYAFFAGHADAVLSRNHAAYDLNHAPVFIQETRPARAPTPASAVFVDKDNVVLETLMPGDDAGTWIVRLFECEGRETDCVLSTGPDFSVARKIDLFGNEVADPLNTGGAISLSLRAYEICSIELRK